MEESAYYLDLTLDVDVPIVFTGAQRRSDEVGFDGYANLLGAVRAGTYERFRAAGGVYLAFDDEIHAARDVTKTHTSRLGTFRSPGKGPVASVTREGLRFVREPGSRSASLPALETDAEVAMVETGLGVGAGQLERALDAGVDGIVVEGTGLGNVTAPLGNAVRDAIDSGVPVVVASRCLAGNVAAVYGTEGGGHTLREHGAISAGDLPAHKARLKLMLALAAADDSRGVREFFEGERADD
jgi:L-asparaginase